MNATDSVTTIRPARVNSLSRFLLTDVVIRGLPGSP
jgi:hypothetical protein